MTGHRTMLTAMQTRSLARPIRVEALPHDPKAHVISSPSVTSWLQRSNAR